jgi:cyclohexanecarboxylate-CoA ligase
MAMTSGSAPLLRPTCPNPRAQEYRDAGLYTGEQLWRPLAVAASEAPDKTALVDGPVRISYADYWRRVQAAAAGLREAGVRPGTTVVYQIPNWLEHCIVHYAVLVAGAVAVPLVASFRQHELRHVVGQLSPSAVVCADSGATPGEIPGLVRDVLREARPAARLIVVRPRAPLPAGALSFETLLDGETAAGAAPAPAPAAPDDVCTVIYTSGSTSAPKGVLHTHETLLYDARSRVGDFGLTSRDVIFMPSSLAHVSGLSYGIHLACILRSTVVLLDRWSPSAAVNLIEAEQATIMNGATLMLRGLVEEYQRRETTSALRLFACGGADVPPALIPLARSVLDAYVTRAYGCSEAPTLTWGRPGDDPVRVANSDGRAIGAVELRVVDGQGEPAQDGQVGECEAMGPERCVGYVDQALNAEAFRPDGWLRTGDWVAIDADGYLSVEGRKKDVIVRAGENISAREVEQLLTEHEWVRESAVVAMPDERLGERAYAFVEVTDGHDFGLEQVRAHFAARGVAKIKWPEFVEVCEELPRTGAGKIDKSELRGILAARRSAGAGHP